MVVDDTVGEISQPGCGAESLRVDLSAGHEKRSSNMPVPTCIWGSSMDASGSCPSCLLPPHRETCRIGEQDWAKP